MINTITALDEYLYETELKKNREKVMTSHHPSGASSCMRQLYYKWKRTEITDPTPPKDIWRMMFGRYLHEMYAKLLVEAGFKAEDEIEITFTDDRLKYPIHGYMDNVFSINGEKYAVELKTVFGYGAKSIQISGKPRAQDETQMKIYLGVTRDIKYMIAPYIARDSFYRTEFCFTMTDAERDEFMELVIEKFARLEMYVEQDRVPNRDYQVCIKDGEFKDSVQHKTVKYKSNWQCFPYCQYRSHCWAEELSSMDMVLPEIKSEDEYE